MAPRRFGRPICFAAALACSPPSPPRRRAPTAAKTPPRNWPATIDGLKVGISAANYIYLSHPAAKELSLGCNGENFSIELYAKADRKPKPEFFDLVAATAAIIFTVPKDDTTTGTSRCIKRMGLLRGDKVSMRYRRLNMECARTKTEASIAVTRGKDE